MGTVWVMFVFLNLFPMSKRAVTKEAKNGQSREQKKKKKKPEKRREEAKKWSQNLVKNASGNAEEILHEFHQIFKKLIKY